MKSRLWLNLALVVVIAVLAALIYFKPGIKKPAPPATLTHLRAADITSIRISRVHTPTVELVRDGASWRMTAPLDIQADQYLVKNLLDDMNESVKSSFPAKQADLGKYGLNPPPIRLWLNRTEFDFGATEPINDYRYVKTGDSIRLTPGLLYFRLIHSPMWWVSKRLLPKDAHIIGLQLPHATLTLKNDKWQLAPANPALSADAIQNLVTAWSTAQAISVGKLGPGKPEGEVAIELAHVAKPLRFAILKEPGFLVLARPDLGLQYNLDRYQRTSLLELKNPARTPAATPAKPAALSNPRQPAHTIHKEPPHAGTAGSRNHPPRNRAASSQSHGQRGGGA